MPRRTCVACSDRVRDTVIAVVTAPCLIATRPARAQPRHAKSAAKHTAVDDPKLSAGMALFDARELEKAATEFERVYGSAKEPRALYWQARALQASGHLAAALRAYTKYVREAGPSTVQTRGVEVLGAMQTLTMQVAVVTVSAPEGSTISVDDVVVGKTPLTEPLYVDPGKHTIAATRGTATASKLIDAAEEGRLTVDLAPMDNPKSAADPAPAPAAPPPPSPTNDVPAGAVRSSPSSPSSVSSVSSRSSGVSGLTVSGLGVATLLAAGSVYFAIKAGGSASDFDAKKAELGVTRSELDSLQGSARLQAGLSAGLGIGALGVAGLTQHQGARRLLDARAHAYRRATPARDECILHEIRDGLNEQDFVALHFVDRDARQLHLRRRHARTGRYLRDGSLNDMPRRAPRVLELERANRIEEA
jgi:hypothetical protein